MVRGGLCSTKILRIGATEIEPLLVIFLLDEPTSRSLTDMATKSMPVANHNTDRALS